MYWTPLVVIVVVICILFSKLPGEGSFKFTVIHCVIFQTGSFEAKIHYPLRGWEIGNTKNSEYSDSSLSFIFCISGFSINKIRKVHLIHCSLLHFCVWCVYTWFTASLSCMHGLGEGVRFHSLQFPNCKNHYVPGVGEITYIWWFFFSEDRKGRNISPCFRFQRRMFFCCWFCF